MKLTLMPLALLAALATSTSLAGPLEDRVEFLSRELMNLSREVATLKTMLNRDNSGSMILSATPNRMDTVANAFATNAWSSTLAVGQSRSTRIGVDDVLTVGGAGISTVNGNWRLHVGGEATSNFAHSHAQAFGQSRTTQIGVNDVLTVAGSSTSNVGGNWTLSVNGSANQQVANNLSVSAAREILIQAGDQIRLRTGDASIVMKKDGSILITGKQISAISSGDVILKGAKVLTN